jgi:N-acyl-D-amino-acid deacylase
MMSEENLREKQERLDSVFDFMRRPCAMRHVFPGTMKFLFFALLLVSTAPAADFDLLITNARIADGSGAPLVSGSIAVKARKIVAAGPIECTADQIINAGSKVAAPGFIDVHTHSEVICRIPIAENFLRMSVTTIVTGNCGNSRTDVA